MNRWDHETIRSMRTLYTPRSLLTSLATIIQSIQVEMTAPSNVEIYYVASSWSISLYVEWEQND